MATTVKQPGLFESGRTTTARNPAFSGNKEEAIHRWVPWIAGFSAEFVRSTLREFLPHQNRGIGTVLDPFAGVGTTLVETVRAGHHAVGFEINPYAALAARVKLGSASLDLEELIQAISRFRRFVERRVAKGMKPSTNPPSDFRSRVPFYSERVLPQVLHCIDFIRKLDEPLLADVFKLAFGSVMVSFSNYSYEPSLTTRQGVGRQPVLNANVSLTIERKLRQMANDMAQLRGELRKQARPRCELYEMSFMNSEEVLNGGCVDLVITSPPYLNNYHYVRNTRPQIYWLGLNKETLLYDLEDKNVGKFWQRVREGEPITLDFSNKSIASQIDAIRKTNKSRGAYGGPGWANYAASYYNDTNRYLGIIRKLLRRKGVAVIVIGNSIIQGVNLPVDKHIEEIGKGQRFQSLGIRLLRKKRVGSSIVDSSRRNGKKTNATLYESAVILSKP